MQLDKVKIQDSSTGWLTLYAWAVCAGKEKERIRWSLGTKKAGEAENRKDRIARCVSEGVSSSLWPTLNEELPSRTFKMLADLMG